MKSFQIACQLSERFKHHLFDTLYHAVAIYSGNTQFITADDQYYRISKEQSYVSLIFLFLTKRHIPLSR
jgi:predicted nucleic acid-binding protein